MKQYPIPHKPFPIPKVIYCDVDGTLINRYNMPNETLLDFLRQKKTEGYDIVLWSMAGKEHAKEVADWLSITDLFTAILAKPGYIIDNDCNWVKQMKRIGFGIETENRDD